MYGTFYRMQPKAGQQQAVLDHLFRWEQEYLPRVTGYIRGYVFEPATQALPSPFGILVIVVFDTPAACARHRDNPEQACWDQHLLLLLEHAPERNEGEITELFAEARGL
jgi:hypothetical protein